MRTLLLVLGMVVAAAPVAYADDTAVTPPADAQAVIDRVEAAVASNDAKALLAVAAAKVTVDDLRAVTSKSTTRGKLAAVIKKAGGVTAWLRITSDPPSWTVTAQGADFRVEHGDGAFVVIASSGGHWKIREIQLAGTASAQGGLTGTGEMTGGYGFGSSGSGGGGGCGGGLGTIGTGRYGTIGHGSGTGTGGGGCGGMGRGRSSAPRATLSKPVVSGKLDKAIVRRYLLRNKSKLAYCYEKALLAKPALKGTLAIAFTIDGNGAVQSPTAKGVDPDVESCVTGVLPSIEFPKPPSGTVSVAFKITYAPTGG